MYFEAGQHKNAGLTFNPLKAIIAPRPIGWVSSFNEMGQSNLAPYSFFNVISETPAMIGFCAVCDTARTTKDRLKDSVRNITQKKEFVLNIVSHALLDKMHATSAAFDETTSEFDAVSLKEIQATKVHAPMVKEAPCHLECQLWNIIDLPHVKENVQCKWIMATIIAIHIKDEYIENGKLDITKYQPVARLGYQDYTYVERIISKKPAILKENEK